MHGLQEKTCNSSKRSFKNYCALVCLTVLSAAVNVLKSVSPKVVI